MFAMAAASGSGSSTGPINNCANPDVSCADLDIVTNSPGAQDGYEDTQGALVAVNWNDSNRNGLPDNKEIQSYDSDMVLLKISGLGLQPATGFREGKLWFDPDLFRVWKQSSEVIGTGDRLNRLPTTLYLGDLIYVEAIAPKNGQNTAIKLTGDRGWTDTVVLHPVHAYFKQGKYSATNNSTLPAHPQVLFAQANYATPLAFEIAGLPPVNGVSGATIATISSYLLEANEDRTQSTPLTTVHITSARYVNGVNGDSLTKSNGQSFDYTVFVPSSKFRGFTLGASKDWTPRAYFAVEPRFSYGQYPAISVTTNVDAETATLINFYDQRVDALDLHNVATAPPTKNVPVVADSEVRYYDKFAGPMVVSTQAKLQSFFDAASGSAGYESSDITKAYVKSEINELTNSFSAPRWHGRVLSTRYFSSKVYVSYGGRLVPSALGSTEFAMDLRVDVGAVNFRMFPNAKFILTRKEDLAGNFGTIAIGAGSIMASAASATATMIGTYPYGTIVAGGVALASAVLNAVQLSLPTPTGRYWESRVGYQADYGRLKGMTTNQFEVRSSEGLSINNTVSSIEIASSRLADTEEVVPVGDAVVRIVTLNAHVDGSENVGTDGNVSASSIATLKAGSAQDYLQVPVSAFALKSF